MDAAVQPHLTPSRVVEVLDRTFRVYRDNFVLFIGLVALFLVPLNLLQFLVTNYITEHRPEFTSTQDDYYYDYDYYYEDDPFYYEMIPALINLSIIALQIIFIYSVISYIVSEHYLGREVTLWEALAAVKRRWLPLGVAVGLVMALPFGVVLAMVLADSIMGETFASILAVVGICLMPILGLVAFYLLWNLLAFLVPVLVLEEVSVVQGMRRSLGLAKSRWWPVFWFFFSILVIYSLVFTVLLMLGTILVGVSEPSFFEFAYESNTSTEFLALQMIVTTLIGVVMIPIIPTGMTLLYYDTRIRLEGLDLALQLVKAKEPRPSDIPSPNLYVPIISGTDIVNIVLLVVGTFGACSAISGFFYITAVLFATW